MSFVNPSKADKTNLAFSLRIRREDILTACDASLITLKTHIAPFLYNIKAREWYNAIEVMLQALYYIPVLIPHTSR